jgi:hypothetical protein
MVHLSFLRLKHQLKFTLQTAVVKEGQTLFIPSGWWHLELNLTDTISINHSWTSQQATSTDNPVATVLHNQKDAHYSDDAMTLHKLRKEIEQLKRELHSSLKSISTSAACERYYRTDLHHND